MNNNHKNTHSFVVLAYKDSPYLEDCLRSLISQSIPSHIMVTTSTPTDGQRALADKYGIPYIVNNEHKDIATDWNFALDAVDSQWVTLAHQDDIYAADYTESMLAAIDAPGEVLIRFSNYSQLSESGVESKGLLVQVKRIILAVFYPFSSVLKWNFLKRWSLAFGCPICCPTVMYNKLSLRTFKFDESFQVDLDWRCWIELAEYDGTFVYIKKDLLQHRIHDNATTNLAIDSGLRRAEDERCFKLLWPRFIVPFICRFYALSYKTG